MKKCIYAKLLKISFKFQSWNGFKSWISFDRRWKKVYPLSDLESQMQSVWWFEFIASLFHFYLTLTQQIASHVIILKSVITTHLIFGGPSNLLTYCRETFYDIFSNPSHKVLRLHNSSETRPKLIYTMLRVLKHLYSLLAFDITFFNVGFSTFWQSTISTSMPMNFEGQTFLKKYMRQLIFSWNVFP